MNLTLNDVLGHWMDKPSYKLMLMGDNLPLETIAWYRHIGNPQSMQNTLPGSLHLDNWNWYKAMREKKKKWKEPLANIALHILHYVFLLSFHFPIGIFLLSFPLSSFNLMWHKAPIVMSNFKTHELCTLCNFQLIIFYFQFNDSTINSR